MGALCIWIQVQESSKEKKGDESQVAHNEGYDSDEVLLMATIKIGEEQNDEDGIWIHDAQIT